MTRNDIIRMAREVGATNVDAADPQCWVGAIAFEMDELERFAALITAAKEAEHQQTLALQQRSYEREIQLEVEAEIEAAEERVVELFAKMKTPYLPDIINAIHDRTP